MKGIGGNINAALQISTTTKNSIGELVKTFTNAVVLHGWLDLVSGDSKYTTYNSKIQESTHVFICDYVQFPGSVKPENSRMVINGNVYDITLIDNPMEMGAGSQLEIYLKFTGGQ